MKIITRAKQLKKIVQNQRVGFVPTMGNLHDGHVALIKQAKKRYSFTVVSIFINPKQFGQNEDFKSYPRTYKNDIAILIDLQVDVLFYPQVEEIYQLQTQKFQTYIGNKTLEKLYCGKFRPEFFSGVLLIILKLFNLIKPVEAFFGKKDFQQFFLIKRMVDDLNLDIIVTGVATKRTSGGLAMSSRNNYFDLTQQKEVEIIFKSLQQGKNGVKQGKIKSPLTLKKKIASYLKDNPSITIQYIEVVDKTTLFPAKNLRSAIVLFAGFYRGVRLIDNIEI